MKDRKHLREHICATLRRVGDGNGAMSFLVQVPQLLIRIFLDLQHFPCALQIYLAGFRRDHTVPASLEQRHPDFLLQLQQLLVQC